MHEGRRTGAEEVKTQFNTRKTNERRCLDGGRLVLYAQGELVYFGKYIFCDTTIV